MKRYYTSEDIELTQLEYLYGEDVEVPDIPSEIIMRRVEILSDHLTELLEVPLEHRDNARANAVLRARNFWNNINTIEGE